MASLIAEGRVASAFTSGRAGYICCHRVVHIVFGIPGVLQSLDQRHIALTDLVHIRLGQFDFSDVRKRPSVLLLDFLIGLAFGQLGGIDCAVHGARGGWNDGTRPGRLLLEVLQVVDCLLEQV